LKGHFGILKGHFRILKGHFGILRRRNVDCHSFLVLSLISRSPGRHTMRRTMYGNMLDEHLYSIETPISFHCVMYSHNTVHKTIFFVKK
jgi:hypothetical protein